MEIVTHYNYVYLDLTRPAKIETEMICFLYSPLYVGKGKGNRCFHGKIALEEGKQLLTNKLLYSALRKLQRRKIDPEILMFNEGVTSSDALLVEASIILSLGRHGIEKTGILCNRALGGEVPDTTGLPSPIRGKKMKDHLTPERYEKYIKKLTEPKTKEALKKMVDTRRKNGSYTIGSAHPRAKLFILISPNAERFEIVGGLKKFCIDKELSWQMLFNHQDLGQIKFDRSRYKNTTRLSQKSWNTIGWECRSAICNNLLHVTD